MSAPSGEQPPGSLVRGSGFSQNETESSAIHEMTGGVVDSVADAQQAFELNIGALDLGIIDLTDGQAAYATRLDLLDDVSAYATACMDRNWDLPHQSARQLPFPMQVGPAKSVSIANGRLALKKKGLWRVDAHTTIQGYTRSYTVTPVWNGTIWILVTTWYYWPLVMTYWLEIVGPGFDGPVYTAREFNAIPNVALTDPNYWSGGGVPAPQTSHFNHTFVLPDTVDPNISSTWYFARLIGIERTNVNIGTVDYRQCKSLGGTKQSALCATRWSPDVAFANHPETVPDGGDL